MIILTRPTLRGNACDVITPRYSVIFISANSSRKPRKMGVSSRYKLRHRTKENRGNKNEHPQKRHKSKVTKNVLVKKTVTLAYLRGFRLFSGAKTKVHQSDRKRKTSLSKSSKKLSRFTGVGSL